MTPRFRPLRSVLAASGLGLCLTLAAVAPSVWAADQAKSDDKVRAELGKPLQAAQQALAAKNYQEALSQLAQADAAVKDKTPYETYMINRMRGVAAAGSGDLPTASKSLQAAIDSGKMPPPDQVQVMGMLVGLYTNAKDYPNAVAWTQRYIKAGGNDPAILSNMVAEEYQAGDYASASRDAAAQIDAAEKAGQKPTETQIKILAASYHSANNDAAYATAIEKMVIYYPKPEYWADLIGHIDHKPGFSDRLFLDINRLQRVTGSLTNYDAMVELDLQDGISSEAKAVADEGGSKVPKALQAKAAAAASDDRKKLDRDAKDAEGFKDGNVLVTIGYTFVGFGEKEKGIDLLQKGIAKGGLKHPDEAKLMLGIAYFQAGQMPKAIETFNSVTGGNGAADVAHLWAIRAKQG